MTTRSTPVQVGNAVRMALKHQGVSQGRIALELGLTRAAITRRIAGEVEFSASQLSTIAERTGASVDALLFNTAGDAK